MAIAAEKRVPREFCGGAIVGLLLHGRDALARGLVGESVDVVFLRELVRGPRLVAQQIGYGVVVLAVRQAPHHRRLRGRTRRSLGADAILRQADQVGDPFPQRLLFFTSRMDALATGVLRAVRGLAQEQRLVGIFAIHQRGKPQAERNDLRSSGLFGGKLQAGAPGYSIVVGAQPALRLFEYRIQFGDKVRN